MSILVADKDQYWLLHKPLQITYNQANHTNKQENKGSVTNL